MAASTEAALPLLSAEAGEHEDSNISSPLSEVDDKDGNDEEIEQMQLDEDEGDNSSLSEVEAANPTGHDGDNSDSDSVLSEANSDMNSDMNDTEAETERLYDTPQNQRQRDVLVDRYNDGQVFEHTPSRLRSIKTLHHTHNNGDEESLSGDNASVASSQDDDAESPSKRIGTRGASAEEKAKRDSQERKRKRPSIMDPSDSEEPLRKRKTSVGPIDADEDENAIIDDDVTPAVETEHAGDDEDGDASPRKVDADDDETPMRETRTTKKVTRSGSRRKGADLDEAEEATEAEAEVDTEVLNEEQRESAVEEEAGPHGDEVDADADEEADLAAKNLEEMERKHAAFKDWSHIEEMFGVFRDRLYKDRLQRIEEEEQSLLADVPTHPEYLNMRQCIDDRLNQKVDEFNKEYDFRIQALQRRAVAQRAQIWSQYFQSIREKREHALETLNKEWYDVQASRRSAHSMPDYGLLFPKESNHRLRNAIAYNSEVSTLAGLAKYEGFPAAPTMNGASYSEIQDDFNAIERARQGRQKPQAMPPREEYHATTFNHLGPAGEQFIKDTPWANPNHSAHKVNAPVPGSSQSKPEQSGPVNRLNQSATSKSTANGPDGTRPPAATPIKTSTSPEIPRTMLSSSSHQMKRVSLPGMARGSKTAAA